MCKYFQLSVINVESFLYLCVYLRVVVTEGSHSEKTEKLKSEDKI